MQVRELQVPGAFEFTPVQHGDDRGLFLEWFKVEKLVEAIGHPMTLAQANLSVSKAGTLRGVHFADVPPGQAKYVTCPRGAALDVVVDLRVGSPTFGQERGQGIGLQHARASETLRPLPVTAMKAVLFKATMPVRPKGRTRAGRVDVVFGRACCLQRGDRVPPLCASPVPDLLE